MLLHVTHTHTPESCPGPHVERMRAFNEGFSRLEEIAESNGVKVVSVTYAFPAHTGFFVIDAPTARAAQNFFGGIFPGVPANVQMTPVVDLAEAMQVIAQTAG